MSMFYMITNSSHKVPYNSNMLIEFENNDYSLLRLLSMCIDIVMPGQIQACHIQTVICLDLLYHCNVNILHNLSRESYHVNLPCPTDTPSVPLPPHKNPTDTPSVPLPPHLTDTPMWTYHVPGIVGQPVDYFVDTTDRLKMFGFDRSLIHQEYHKAGGYERHGQNKEDGDHHLGTLHPTNTG